MPTDTPGPLTETVYYILLALHAPLHGYGVMQYVHDMSGGRTNLGPGTLYGALATLTEKGWITPVDVESGDRKKEYLITDVGRHVVAREIERLEELVGNGRRVRAEEEK
jgi:DNA-binding PadR family transcriptional regulator